MTSDATPTTAHSNSNSIADNDDDDEQSLGARSTRSTRSTGSLGAILQMMNNERLRISRHRAPHRGRRRPDNRRGTAVTTASSKSGDSNSGSIDPSRQSQTDGGIEVRRLTDTTVIEGDLNDDNDSDVNPTNSNHESFLDAVNAVQMEYDEYGGDDRSILTGMTGKSFEKEVVGAYIDDLTTAEASRNGHGDRTSSDPSQQSLQIPRNINIIDGTGSKVDATVIQATQADIDRDVVEFWHNYISAEDNQDADDMSDLDDDGIDGDNEEHQGDETVGNDHYAAAKAADDNDNRSVVSTRSISTHGSLGVLLASMADDMSRQSIHKMAKTRNCRGGRRASSTKNRRDFDDEDEEEDDGDPKKPRARRGRRRKSERDEIGGNDDVELAVEGKTKDDGSAAPNENLQEIILQVCSEHEQQDPSNRRQPSAVSVSSSASYTDSLKSSTDEEDRVARNRERDAFEKQERKKSQSSGMVDLPVKYDLNPEAVFGHDGSNHENIIPTDPSSIALATKSLPLTTKPSKAERNVSFSSIEIRQYERVLGDHPSSFGPAMSIGWDHDRAATKTVDISDEESKASMKISRRHRERRGPRILPRPLREIMLLDLGYSQQELASANNRAIVRTKRERQRTYHNSEGVGAKIDENIEKVKKGVEKMKRRMSNGTSADPAEEWLRTRK